MEEKFTSFEDVLKMLLDDFEAAQEQNPNIDVNVFIKEKLSQMELDELQESVNESNEFIDEIDINTAKVMEDTKRMRLDEWVDKNIIETLPEEDRDEFKKGLEDASDNIMKQTVESIENEEEKEEE